MGWLFAALFIVGGLGVGFWLYRQDPKANAEFNLSAGGRDDSADASSDGGGGGDGGGD